MRKIAFAGGAATISMLLLLAPAASIADPIMTIGTAEDASAAMGWFQFAAIPQSITTTNLVLSTDPNGDGQMIQVDIASGGQLGNTYGNGIGQLFSQHATGATLTFDILVTSGQVTAGLVSTAGPFADPLSVRFKTS
jgi:hypothetical protein